MKSIKRSLRVISVMGVVEGREGRAAVSKTNGVNLSEKRILDHDNK